MQTVDRDVSALNVCISESPMMPTHLRCLVPSDLHHYSMLLTIRSISGSMVHLAHVVVFRQHDNIHLEAKYVMCGCWGGPDNCIFY
jgi:hypothetical protein